jgi:hypothetical protein
MLITSAFAVFNLTIERSASTVKIRIFLIAVFVLVNLIVWLHPQNIMYFEELLWKENVWMVIDLKLKINIFM